MPESLVDRELVSLASAILRRAFHDLSCLRERHAQDVRNDAFEFLTETLWQDECVWRSILGSRLDRKKVLFAVSLRCQKINDQVEVR